MASWPPHGDVIIHGSTGSDGIDGVGDWDGRDGVDGRDDIAEARGAYESRGADGYTGRDDAASDGGICGADGHASITTTILLGEKKRIMLQKTYLTHHSSHFQV